MSDSTSPIRFFFDAISHNAWIAWTQIHPLAARYGRRVEPVPVLFAGLLAAHGQLGPAEIPAKTVWMVRDLLRKANLLGVELEPPPSHPFNPLLSLRIAGLPMPDDVRHRLVEGLFRAVWTGGPGVTDPEAVAAIATAAGLDGPRAVQQAQGAEAKQRLRRATDDAIAAGVFGVPSMIVDGELFWGFDDFRHLELFLAGKDPLDREALVRWGQLRPTAWRRIGRDKPA